MIDHRYQTEELNIGGEQFAPRDGIGHADYLSKLKGFGLVTLNSTVSLGSRGEGRVHEAHECSIHVGLHRHEHMYVEP